MRATDNPIPGRPSTTPPSRAFVRPEPEPGPARRPKPVGYGVRSRGASAGLLIVLPMLAAYEGGIAWLGGDPTLRTGVDAWIGGAIPRGWGVPGWGPSLVLALGLVAWRVAEPGRFRAHWLALAMVECVVWGAALLGLFLAFDRVVALYGDLILLRAEVRGVVGLDLAEAVGLVGAGVFEEAVFRLGLLGLLYAALRLLHVPNVLATATAVSGSALVFSMAHHVGEAPGAFTWSVFVFRWIAGVYFSWVFILRGFGIAVGTHVAYDLLVLIDPWPG